MKKKIAAVVCILVLTLAIPAAAAGGNGQSAGGGAAVRAGASEGHTRARGMALQARENNLQIRLMNTENYSLRLECQQCIQEYQAGEKDLTEEELAQLKDLQSQLRDQYDLLTATRGQVHELILDYRADRLNEDYDAMAADLEAVTAVQETRMAIKEEINSLLQQIRDLLS